MKRNNTMAVVRWRLGAALALAGFSAAAEPPDPTDPASAAGALETPPVFPQGARDYLGRVDAPGLPWVRLYRPDGSFVPESAFGDSRAAAPVTQTPRPAVAASAQTGDARGVVRKVDTARNRISIKHGPIQKLDMPGMTMSFRVKDPALLDGLAPGDEVAFDVTVEGTTFFVTGIRK